MNSMEILEKLIAIFIALLILLNAYVSKKTVGTWINPSSLHSLFWFVFTFFPLVFLFEIPCSCLSLLFILFSCIFFSVSIFLFNWRNFQHLKFKIQNKYSNKFMINLFYIIMILTFLFQIINLNLNGFSIDKIIYNFMESSAEFTSKRYDEEIEISIFSKLSYVFCYLGIAISGLIYPKLNKNKIIFLIFTFFPPLFIMLSQSAKGSFFLSLFIFYGGILINKILSNNYKLVEKKTIRNFLIIIGIIFPLVLISFLVRVFNGENDFIFLFEQMKFSIYSYSFGHIYAFSDWFQFYVNGKSNFNYKIEETTYGFYTFMSIFKLFGSMKFVPLGTYQEYFEYKNLIQTNIYTSYRGLLQDFTIIGSFVYILIKGCFLNLCYYSILKKKHLEISVSIFILMIADFYHSFMLSIFNSNSIYLSFFLLLIILLFNKKITNKI